MKKFKRKIGQIIRLLPVLVTSLAGYIGFGGCLAANPPSLYKGLVFTAFMLAFGVFTGTVIYLMDLKYIGHGFLEK